MLKFIDSLSGALTRFIIFLPFILLGTALTFLLFIDRLIEGKPFSAIFEIIKSPFKALLFFSSALSLVVIDGWQIGFVDLVRTSITRIQHFFTVELFVDAEKFFATLGETQFVDYFQGYFVGAMIQKAFALIFSYKWFVIYENYADSPHNPINTSGIEGAYATLQNKYGLVVEHNIDEICDAINALLDARIQLANEPDAEDDLPLALAAKRCFDYFQDENDTLEVIDLNAPKPLLALCLIWIAIEQEIPQRDQATYKGLLVAYMGHIQRGLNNMMFPTDEGGSDSPECPTGAVALMLEVLKSIPAYTTGSTKVEAAGALRELITDKLNRAYTIEFKSARKSLGITMHMENATFVEGFKARQQKPIAYYSQSLFHKKPVD